MNYGTADGYLPFFPPTHIPTVLSLLLEVWPTVPKPLATDHEVPISKEFAHRISRLKQARRLPFRCDCEATVMETLDKDEGRVDIRFSCGHDDDVYLAFECKRLRISRKKHLDSGTTQYVENGMMRFIVGKYSKGLPDGGMVAYVMDGNVSAAIDAVGNAIESSKQIAAMSRPTKSRYLPAAPSVQESVHRIEGRELILQHVFLAV